MVAAREVINPEGEGIFIAVIFRIKNNLQRFRDEKSMFCIVLDLPEK